MAIKNYSSKVDVYTSLGEIQGALAKGGARKIMIDYDETGDPIGLTFGLLVEGQIFGFQLPANIDGVLAAFKREKIKVDREQAKRTGLAEYPRLGAGSDGLCRGRQCAGRRSFPPLSDRWAGYYPLHSVSEWAASAAWSTRS